MLLVYKNPDTKEIGISFVNDNDAEVLEATGYYHSNKEDYIDHNSNGRYVEVWKPSNDI